MICFPSDADNKTLLLETYPSKQKIIFTPFFYNKMIDTLFIIIGFIVWIGIYQIAKFIIKLNIKKREALMQEQSRIKRKCMLEQKKRINKKNLMNNKVIIVPSIEYDNPIIKGNHKKPNLFWYKEHVRLYPKTKLTYRWFLCRIHQYGLTWLEAMQIPYGSCIGVKSKYSKRK